MFSFLGFDSGTGAYGYDSTWTLAKALNSTLTGSITVTKRGGGDLRYSDSPECNDLGVT